MSGDVFKLPLSPRTQRQFYSVDVSRGSTRCRSFSCDMISANDPSVSFAGDPLSPTIPNPFQSTLRPTLARHAISRAAARCASGDSAEIPAVDVASGDVASRPPPDPPPMDDDGPPRKGVVGTADA